VYEGKIPKPVGLGRQAESLEAYESKRNNAEMGGQFTSLLNSRSRKIISEKGS